MSKHGHLQIDILPSGKQLIIRVEEGGEDPSSAVSLLETIDVPWDEVELLSQEIRRHLTSQRQARSVRNRLERAGQLLFDLLFGRQSKNALRHSLATHLILRLHANLLPLPWELLHDGESFLALRFAMGRLVQAEDERVEIPRSLGTGPMSMVIIADPSQDLPRADEEGQQLLDLGFEHGDRVEPNLLPSPTGRRQVLEALKQYPMVHLAGHGEAGGWRLSDGVLEVSDIERIRGGSRFPSLVFANACVSGDVSRWDPGAKALARTFLLGGSRHFIGACCDLPDRTGMTLALRFYESLWAGKSIGEALALGRKRLADDLGLPPFAWAGYVLYGDPTFAYFDHAGPIETPAPTPHVIIQNTQKIPRTEGFNAPAPHPPVLDPAPAAHTPMAAGAPQRLSKRISRKWGAFTLIFALICSFLGGVEAFGSLSGLWWSSVHRIRGPQSFNSHLTLLGISRNVADKRLAYAQLLEAWGDYPGPGPEVIAFDTWLRAPDAENALNAVDYRLFDAIAGALPKFSVVFAQRIHEDEVDLPPAWLLDGVMASLKKQCVHCDEAAHARLLKRLRFGHVAVERMSDGLFGEMDHRIPFFCESVKSHKPMPFSWQVAYNQVGRESVCRGGGLSYGVHGESVDIPLDLKGRLRVHYTGVAQWNQPVGGDFTAFDLQSFLTQLDGPSPSPALADLEGQMIIVGLAQSDALARDADRRPTAIGEMYGVEVQANAVEQLRQRLTRKPLPAPMEILLGLITALAGLWISRRQYAGVMFLAGGTLILMMAYGAWRHLGLYIAPVAPLLILTGIWLLKGMLVLEESPPTDGK